MEHLCQLTVAADQFAGCVDGGPGENATNKEYLKNISRVYWYDIVNERIRDSLPKET